MNSALEEKPPTTAMSSSIRTNRRARLPRDEPRQKAADPHREQVGADDGRELEDAVANQVARHRAGDQLVDQPARGNEQDREEQRDRHRLSPASGPPRR